MPAWGANNSNRNGWNWDIGNTRLDFGYRGTRAGHLNASGMTLLTTLNLLNDTIFSMGTGGDVAQVERSSVLNANTALTGVIIGTPVVTAMPADTLIQSNLTASGDFVWLLNDGSGNSWEYLRFDGSAKLLVINEASNAIDFRVETDGNSNGLTMIASTDSMALGSATVAGAALSISNLTGRTRVTAVGGQVHVPSGSFTDSGSNGTIAVLASAFVGAETVLATNTITYTDAAAVRVLVPVASTGATFTRVYSVWASGQIRADSNVQILNTNTFGSTQPVGALVLQSSGATAPVGAITTGGAIYTDGTVIKKLIAAGTVSNIETVLMLGLFGETLLRLVTGDGFVQALSALSRIPSILA